MLEKTTSSTDFLGRQIKYKLAVRQQSESAFPYLIDISNNILAQIDAYQKRVQGIEFNKHENHAPYLIAQFLQGVALCYSAILEGLYAQAANLQKQQIETLTALEELDNKNRRDGKVPNVGNNLQHFKAEYNNLNNVAHPAKAQYVIDLGSHNKDGKQGPTTIPQFIHGNCKYMLGNHCIYLLHSWRYLEQNNTKLFSIEPSSSERDAIFNMTAQITRSQQTES